MKKLLTFTVLLLTLVSCNKTSLDEKQTQISSQERASGLLPDPPELKKYLDLKVSQDFLENGRTLAFNKQGKKLVDMSINDAESLMTSQAKGGNGWGQGGNPGSGGGSTGGGSTGGGTTGGTTDWNPPLIIAVTPANGSTYNLSGQWQIVHINASVSDDIALARIKVSVRGDVLLDTTAGLLSGTGNWNNIDIPYYFPYGDGTYNMTWQAWDVYGNQTVVNSVFTRNTEFTVVPTTLPSSYVLPYPKDPYIQQGGEGACAAFAVSSAFTIQKFVRGGGGIEKAYSNNNVYSPEWIYNIAVVGRGCGYGSSVLSNMGTVVNRGVPTWSYLPFSSLNGCDTSMFTQAIRDNAAQNKGIWGFSSPTADINAIKYNITRGYVGMFGYQLASDMSNPPASFVWNFPHFHDMSSHASCIIGYDDSKHAFLMLNSWGATWADQGALWIDYDFFWQEICGSLYYFGN